MKRNDIRRQEYERDLPTRTLAAVIEDCSPLCCIGKTSAVFWFIDGNAGCPPEGIDGACI